MFFINRSKQERQAHKAAYLAQINPMLHEQLAFKVFEYLPIKELVDLTVVSKPVRKKVCAADHVLTSLSSLKHFDFSIFFFQKMFGQILRYGLEYVQKGGKTSRSPTSCATG